MTDGKRRVVDADSEEVAGRVLRGVAAMLAAADSEAMWESDGYDPEDRSGSLERYAARLLEAGRRAAGQGE